ncbi:MAG TPA: adenylate/guanylate cyclase domain-containing protein [Crinalium sp.]|jgi:adenylate cyclase
MPLLIVKAWNGLVNLLLKRIVLVLTLMLCVAGGIALSNMSQLSTSLIQAQAIQDLTLHAQTLTQAINLYSDAAVDRAKTVNGVIVTHDYLTHTGGIPLPSTFAIELGERISEQDEEMAARLYSDYPFPWRKAKGGPKDAFERDAIAYLRQNPQKPFIRFEQANGHTIVRYAEASLMKPTCVACHNRDEDSPKRDWEVGDVGGVWEISESLDDFVKKVNHNLRGTLFMLGGMSVLGLSGVTLVIGKLRRTAKELEGRVTERTADLVQANLDLEKRNQLIRQVFGRYLSDSVVNNLLDSPEGLKLGGDRRRVTILTSDLRGFTSLSERLQPEEVIAILNLYLEHMADVINQYQGTIDEFMGDGILVLFGAPMARPDDAMRAVACACAMQLAMGAVNERMNAMGLPRLEMGIGINTGEVVVGNIGSEKRTKYGIVGNQVNLTYRIESYTKGGQILISEQTLKETRPNVKITDKMQVQPKGIKQPITLYDVYGIGGRYNMYLPRDEERFVALPEAIALQYTILDGKHINTMTFKGQLVQLSMKGAEICSESANAASLPPATANIKLNLLVPENAIAPDPNSPDSDPITDAIYAKVLNKRADQGHFYIHFTAVPPEIQIWLEALYQAIANDEIPMG